MLLKYLGVTDQSVLYIGGSDKLPAPLSREEEMELLNKLMHKDDNARKRLVEKNLRLVVYIAKKFENSGVNIEDLISIGTIGLMKAVNSFNLDKNIKLATYASRCIENEILMHLRKVQRTKTEISIDEPINIDSEGNDLSLVDILGSDNDAVYKEVEESDNRKVLRAAIMELNDREKDIMQMRYGFEGKDELTQKEVADKLGISQSYISRIEKKVINRLKKEFFI
ncbi:MAG: RNA polymerase sporulation sigma factor SigE [Clostridia bacterium]|nr:RNA polymerase sporulation sigma factor SigE [Clostridia bacterium]MDD4375334.1 RNA polymerase sporulation sigma factor SigE [Clostridia bacterium]